MSDAKNSFVLPKNRERITREPDTHSRWTPQYPEMTGFTNQGGGHVPEDLSWGTNPKQWQEELTEEQLRKGK